jgi:hypothetical protein
MAPSTSKHMESPSMARSAASLSKYDSSCKLQTFNFARYSPNVRDEPSSLGHPGRSDAPALKRMSRGTRP